MKRISANRAGWTGLLCAVAAACVLCSCEESPTESEDQAPPIQTASEASSAAFEISTQISGVVLGWRSEDKTWSGDVFDGVKGTMTVTGSYDYRVYSYSYSYPDKYYEFDNVRIECNGYTSDNNEDYAVIMTGSATLSGTVKEDVGSTRSSYSGGWTLSGTFKLEGRFSDNVTIRLSYSEDSMHRDYSGTLTAQSGESYTVSK